MDSSMQKKTENSSAVNSESKPVTAAIAENQQWVAESAYYKALARSFTSNREQEDWLEAEKDYQAMLSKQQKNGLVSLR